MKYTDRSRVDAKDRTRRNFLKAAAAAGGGAVASSLLPGLAQASAGTQPDKAASEPASTSARYRVTEHVASYYDTLK